MIVKRTIIGILWLALLVGSAAAIDLSPSTISSSNTGWLIANDGADSSTITVYALQAGAPPTPVTSANVTFSLDPASTDLGTLSPSAPVSVQTGSDGKATAVFTTSKKSGTAIIHATISFYDGITTPIQVTTTQKIDHDAPQGTLFDYPASLPVGSVTNITITVVDRWGNRVDSKNVAETVRITMSDEGGAGLWDGSGFIPQNTYSTNAEGNVTAQLRISTTVRSNYVQMDPIGNIVIPPGKYIQGVSETEPWYIKQTAASPGSTLPANGDPENAVEIYYLVTDRFDNPILGASVYCNSTDGMTMTGPTNSYGLLRISFGPKDTIGYYTLTAIPLGNTSAVCKDSGTVGYCSQTIKYYNTDPVDLTFTGSPQSMTSLDVNPSSKSDLQARVIDLKGNPVIGETVHFSLGTPTYSAGGAAAEVTSPSIFPPSNLVGDTDGYATATFVPGKFESNTASANYNATVTGTVVATATWTNRVGTVITRDITLVWKNYPYISTASEADCGNAQVGDKINITIQLSGDSAALRPKPIDAILVMDMSGSMGPGYSAMNGPLGSQLKYIYAAYAGNVFVDKMDSSKDKVGLVIYNNTIYPRDSLSNGFSTVKLHFSQMTTGSGTNQRGGTMAALDDMIAHKDLNHIQAVIVMTDGQYNTWGDPLARGTGSTSTGLSDSGTGYYLLPSPYTGPQNLSRYAADNKIRIYTVTFGTDAAIQKGTTLYSTMDIIANSTGGEHYHATDGFELTDVYEKIAGKLQETAGGNTQVALDFGTVKINDDPNPTPDITAYMNYEYIFGKSTYINKSNITKFGDYNQLFYYTRDDRVNWSHRNMSFDVGTIKLNETWSAKFTLNLTKAGKIDLFGPGSSMISFQDASTGTTQTGFIPARQCRVRESIVNTGFGSKTLRVDNLTVKDGASSDTWTIWNTSYDGEKTVQEAILYQMVDGDSQWLTIPGGLVFTTVPVFEQTKEHTVLVSDPATWPPGRCFNFEIAAGAEDANAARTTSAQKCKPLSSDTIFIKLE